MLSLFFIVYSLFIFVKPTEQQMLSHQHKLEQSCAVCEQKFLGVIRTQIVNLESSIKDGTTRMEILQQKLGRDTALEQRIPPHLPQILQNLQSSLQTLTGRTDDLENIISNIITENVTAVERRIPYNQSTLESLTAGTDNQENCINEKVNKLEQRLPSDLQTTLQNLQSTVQTLTVRTDTLENSITQKVSALEQRIPNLQSTLESLTARTDDQENSMSEKLTELEQRLSTNLQTTLQNLQLPVQILTARTDTLENTITEKVTALEQRVQNLQSTQHSLTTKTDTLEDSITEKVAAVERRIPTSLLSTLQDLNSFVQSVQSRLNIVDTCRQSFLMLNTQPLTGTFQHRCYFYGTSKLTWEAAQAKCRQAGANLVTVSSWGLQRYLQSFVPRAVKIWIGGSDKRIEGRFKWVENDENINDGFSYWEKGEPNDEGRREDCVEMGTNGKWNDQPCHSRRPYICEL